MNINSLFTGKVCHRLEKVDSTNDFARILLDSSSKPLEGTCILADFQSHGRGQRDLHWESQAGSNLLMSLIYYPTFLAANDGFWLSAAVALGVRDAIQAVMQDKVTIKWPNDLIGKEKKLAGILIENQIKKDCLSSSIIGIGLNLNQTHFENDSASSIKLLTGKQWSVDLAFERVCASIEGYYLKLQTKGKNSIAEEYQALLFGKDENRMFSVGESQKPGVIRGVNDQGLLLVEFNGLNQSFQHKEIQMIY